ncbi:hypothetical protein V3M81_09015 [Trueperella pyogenes]
MNKSTDGGKQEVKEQAERVDDDVGARFSLDNNQNRARQGAMR